jgi:hypothetical protein
MLVKILAGVVAIAGLTAAGLGTAYVGSPTPEATPIAAVACEEGSCQVAAAAEDRCKDCCPDCPDCSLCPDCPQCCGGKSTAAAQAVAEAAKPKPADCGDCCSEGKCCVK